MLNNVTLQGRLTRDPELRKTPNGVSVCGFTVAWSEKYKDTETKLFLPCVAWRGTAEHLSKYFAKGQEIVVSGKLTSRKWTDKDNKERETVELQVEQVHFCGSKQSTGGGQAAPVSDPAPEYGGYSYGSGFAPAIGVDDSDLPF